MPDQTEKLIDVTGLAYYHKNLAPTEFATKAELGAVDDRIDDIVAEGGEPNVIEGVQKNNIDLPVVGKKVNVTVPTTVAELSDASDYAQTTDIPTAVSDLTNDGDGTSPFATQAYVGTNGGKIDSFSVNNTPTTIDANKNVNISVPTTVAELSDASDYALAANIPTGVSELTNDSGYQTASDVSSAIGTALSSVYRYKGSVATKTALNNISTKDEGDVYDVQSTGMNYAWNGTKWDELGQEFDTTLLWSKEEMEIATTAEIAAAINGD